MGIKEWTYPAYLMPVVGKLFQTDCSPTWSPDQVVATLCPVVAKLCSVVAMLCPVVAMLCPVVGKLCPVVELLCPVVATPCLVVKTNFLLSIFFTTADGGMPRSAPFWRFLYSCSATSLRQYT
jgi:hypothetical protein